MASMKITDLVMVSVITMVWAARTSWSQSSDCTSVLITMAPCLNYVSGSSPTPSSSCCSTLASVVKSQPRCLCQALNGGGASLGVSINQTLALALPDLCNVKTPPVSKCDAADGPATSISPSDSPVDSPEGVPGSLDDTPSSLSTSGGSKITPATSSSGVAMKIPLQLILFFLPFAFYGST